MTKDRMTSERMTNDLGALTKIEADSQYGLKGCFLGDEAHAADLKGYDTVISAYNPGWTNPDIYNLTLQNYPRILQAAKEAGVKRLLIVGGAGTLFCAPGLRVVDSGVIPAELRPKISASIFKTLSKALTSVPISVTL